MIVKKNKEGEDRKRIHTQIIWRVRGKREER